MGLHDRNVVCQVSKLPDWNLNINGESHTLNHTLDHLALQQGSWGWEQGFSFGTEWLFRQVTQADGKELKSWNHADQTGMHAGSELSMA